MTSTHFSLLQAAAGNDGRGRSRGVRGHRGHADAPGGASQPPARRTPPASAPPPRPCRAITPPSPSPIHCPISAIPHFTLLATSHMSPPPPTHPHPTRPRPRPAGGRRAQLVRGLRQPHAHRGEPRDAPRARGRPGPGRCAGGAALRGRGGGRGARSGRRLRAGVRSRAFSGEVGGGTSPENARSRGRSGSRACARSRGRSGEGGRAI